MQRESLQSDLMVVEHARLNEQGEYLKLKETLVKEKENFVAIALHEINTPLTLLNGYVSMLGLAETLDEARAHAEAIQRTSGRFTVMKMLFDARLHGMHLTAFDLCECAAKAVADPWLLVATRKKPGEVRITYACDGPFAVEADYKKIRVAIWELCRNGLKAVEAGGTVSVEIHAENGHVVVMVEDDGVGIPESYRERIWEAGSQFFTEMTTRRNEGTGHGLYTVRHIMEAHGGSVELDWSEEGKGSRFMLLLPRR